MRKKAAALFIFLTILLAFMSYTHAKDVGKWDKFWASQEGIDPQAYVAVKSLINFLHDAGRNAELARDNDALDKFKAWMQSRLNESVDLYNPDKKGINSIAETLFNNPADIIDWSYKDLIAGICKVYSNEIKKNRDPQKAYKAMLKYEKEYNPPDEITTGNWNHLMKFKEALNIFIISTNKELNPALYPPGAKIKSIEIAVKPKPQETVTPETPKEKKAPEKKREPVPAGTADFTGTWKTSWGDMTLWQSGNAVTGEYTHDNGKIEGTVSGNVLTGKWSEAPTYQPARDAGDFVFTISNDRNSFTGKWRFDSNGDWMGDWNGNRIK